jgi:hypothetical protein
VKRQQHKSTYEKITKHAKSNAHITATNFLKERQKRKIQSSTGLSAVAQHQSATVKMPQNCQLAMLLKKTGHTQTMRIW